MARLSEHDYTGPTWVGPLFKYWLIAAILFHIATNVMDWKTEWECNDE